MRERVTKDLQCLTTGISAFFFFGFLDLHHDLNKFHISKDQNEDILVSIEKVGYWTSVPNGRKSHTKLCKSTHTGLLPVVQKGVVGVGQTFPLDGKPRALKVDIVCESGSKWVKVKAMSGKSIEDLHEGRGRCGRGRGHIPRL